MDKDNLLKLAIETWGKTAQVMMAIEEMSELTKELCKAYRSDGFIKEHIIEEIADCKIMLRQMELIFGFADEWEAKKLERLEGRLNAYIAKE